MKIFYKLERNRSFWFLLSASLVFYLLRLPSLIEPYWYGDEGIYQVIAAALNNGHLLYLDIWDNKPPLLYLIYAIFNGDQFSVRLLSIIFGNISVILFYFLSRKFFKSLKISLITTVIYVLLFGPPFIEGNIANSENFMQLFSLLSALLVFKAFEIRKEFHKKRHQYNLLFISGFSLGLSFLFKTVSFFDFSAFLLFIILYFSEKSLTKNFNKYFLEIWPKLLLYVSGFIIPFLIMSVYFIYLGTFINFIQSVFLGNIDYVEYANDFIIPNGYLILKIFILSSFIWSVFVNKDKFPQVVIFVFIWFVFSIFNSLFSGRTWTHYLLVLVPSTSLMAGVLIYHKEKFIRFSATLLIIILFFISITHFKLDSDSIIKTVEYYKNFFDYLTSQKSLTSYQEFFDRRVPRDYELAQYIESQTAQDDIIFIWGNSPQIYYMSGKLPPGKFAVQYHIELSKESINQTRDMINIKKPKLVIILPETPDYPYSLDFYSNKYSIRGAQIYERIY